MKILNSLACNFTSTRFGKLSSEQFEECKELNEKTKYTQYYKCEAENPLKMLYKLDQAIEKNDGSQKINNLEKQLIHLIHEATSMNMVTFFKELCKETSKYQASREVFENILNRFKVLDVRIPLPQYCNLPDKSKNQETDYGYHPTINTSRHTEY